MFCILAASHCSSKLCYRPRSIFFRVMFMFTSSSLLVSFLMLGIKWWRRCPISTQGFYSMFLVVLRELLFFFLFWCDFYLFGSCFFFNDWSIHLGGLHRFVIRYVRSIGSGDCFFRWAWSIWKVWFIYINIYTHIHKHTHTHTHTHTHIYIYIYIYIRECVWL